MGERLRRRVGADDVVQSVFRTFFRRTEKGEYPIDHSGSLWHLLVTITLNKVRRQGERHGAAKRNVRAEVDLDDAQLSPEAVARGPTPEEAVLFMDELEALLRDLPEPEPEIVRLCLEGHSSSEIAQRTSCSRWTVRRALDRFGRRAQKRLEEKPTQASESSRADRGG
jgi:RNA polymerase sigma factor (sigma-70 family)